MNKLTIIDQRLTTNLYDGEQIIMDYDGTGGGSLMRYYYGPRIDEVICRVDVTQGYGDVPIFYYYDGLGSVVALGSYMGNAAEKYSYDVFGKMTLKKFSPRGLLGNRYMFTGREYDSETGLYYYRARYYHPSIGRFMQADPLGTVPDKTEKNTFGPFERYSEGFNLYTYVENNPIMYIDPHGFECKHTERCRVFAGIYICPHQESPCECQDCCEYMSHLAEPPIWRPWSRLLWWWGRPERLRTCLGRCDDPSRSPLY
jgi:RHS repeat-associated protein